MLNTQRRTAIANALLLILNNVDAETQTQNWIVDTLDTLRELDAPLYLVGETVVVEFPASVLRMDPTCPATITGVVKSIGAVPSAYSETDPTVHVEVAENTHTDAAHIAPLGKPLLYECAGSWIVTVAAEDN